MSGTGGPAESEPRLETVARGVPLVDDRLLLELANDLVIDFYDTRAKWHRRFYRLSSAVVILTGASLPVVTTLDFPGKNAAISGAGFLVAVTVALKGLYRWDVSWTLLRETELELTRAYLSWRGAEPGAPGPGSAGSGATDRSPDSLLEAVFQIRSRESSEFFKNLPDPGPARQLATDRGTA